MATLNNSQVVDLAKDIEPLFSEIKYDQATIVNVLQVFEDWVEDSRAAISASIDAKTSGFTFSAAEKKKIGAYYFKRKFERDK